jgi:hypothetical protein
VLLVKVNVAVPAPTPVTSPSLFTDATEGLLLTHVPPLVGDNVVVPPTQIVVLPVMATDGFAEITKSTGVRHSVELGHAAQKD